MAQRFDHTARQSLIILARVAQVGIHLGQCLLVVDFHKVTVGGQGFFLCVETVNVEWRVVVVCLAMDDGSQWQSVALVRMFVGPARCAKPSVRMAWSTPQATTLSPTGRLSNRTA